MLISWKFFALAAAFFASLTAIFGKIGVADISSSLATFIRTVVILILIGFVLTFKNEWQNPNQLSGKSILFLVLSGIATGLSWLCYYHALQLGPASKVAPIDKLSVVFVILLSLLFLGEQFSWKIAVGGLLITAGSILLLF